MHNKKSSKSSTLESDGATIEFPPGVFSSDVDVEIRSVSGSANDAFGIPASIVVLGDAKEIVTTSSKGVVKESNDFFQVTLYLPLKTNQSRSFCNNSIYCCRA